MAMDVMIKQKLFGNKTMPPEVILGDSLHYGSFENDHLNEGVLGEGEFVAYNPESIGRGFSVVWTPKEKKRIALRLPLPSTERELTDFYAAIARMVRYWDAKLTVDGEKVSLEHFLNGLSDMIKHNEKSFRPILQQVLDGELETLTIYGAKWSLALGKEEAAAFMERPARYAEWLHEKQSMDVYFETPDFYVGDQGILGRYILTDGLPALFPYQPSVPFGITDTSTGKPVECRTWLVVIGIDGEKAPLCEMEYDEFLRRIPTHKQSKYDESRFLLAALTAEEIRELASGKCSQP